MGTTTTYHVRVQPRAKRNAVVPVSATELKVYVTVPPADGRANEAVIELLAQHWGVKRRQIEVVTGATRHRQLAISSPAPPSSCLLGPQEWTRMVSVLSRYGVP